LYLLLNGGVIAVSHRVAILKTLGEATGTGRLTGAATALVVYNPVAGARRRRRLAAAIAALRARGLAPDIMPTSCPGDATVIARAAASAGTRIVIAAGGDGTIAEVANGIADTQAALAVWPMGTANVLAHEWALPFDAESFAAMIAGGRTRPLHPGRASFADGREKLFVQMLGVGFDAGVVAAVTPRLKRRLGKGAYVVRTLTQAFRDAYPRFDLTMDGTRIETASLVATKGRMYAGRFTLSPAARPDAPGFRAVLFGRHGLSGVALYGAALPLGLLPRAPGIRDLPAREIVVHGPAGQPVQADGDRVGATPVVIRDAPPIALLVP
jgi:diacylglycerol kinase family enzyme